LVFTAFLFTASLLDIQRSRATHRKIKYFVKQLILIKS